MNGCWLHHRKTTIGDQIRSGIKNGLSFSDSYEEIISIFKLSRERVERNIIYVSDERWKASIAIGYANGKRVYCFPWLNSGQIIHIKEHIKLCIEVLKKKGAIIILPTAREDTIADLVDEFVFTKGSYEIIHGS